MYLMIDRLSELITTGLTVENLMNSALVKMNENNFIGAMVDLDQVLVLTPNNIPALQRKSICQ